MIKPLTCLLSCFFCLILLGCANPAPRSSKCALTSCVNVPNYTPYYWNRNKSVRESNNCYNYSNNTRTDTFAQPGRMSNKPISANSCAAVVRSAQSDGLLLAPADGSCPSGKKCKGMAKIALVTGYINTSRGKLWDYHWYRLDQNGYWTHKPGGSNATSEDNFGAYITNPETAERGGYTDFCGYFYTNSSTAEGQGNAKIQ